MYVCGKHTCVYCYLTISYELCLSPFLSLCLCLWLSKSKSKSVPVPLSMCMYVYLSMSICLCPSFDLSSSTCARAPVCHMSARMHARTVCQKRVQTPWTLNPQRCTRNFAGLWHILRDAGHGHRRTEVGEALALKKCRAFGAHGLGFIGVQSEGSIVE